jgi:hypothetical protein
MGFLLVVKMDFMVDINSKEWKEVLSKPKELASIMRLEVEVKYIARLAIAQEACDT